MKIKKSDLRAIILQEIKDLIENQASMRDEQTPYSPQPVPPPPPPQASPPESSSEDPDEPSAFWGLDDLRTRAADWKNNSDVRKAVNDIFGTLLAMHGEDPKQFLQSLEAPNEKGAESDSGESSTGGFVGQPVKEPAA